MKVAVVISSALAADVENQIAAGARPRIEHLEFCRVTGADVVRLNDRRPRWSRRLPVRHPLVALTAAVIAWRATRHHDVVITDSEHIGIPLGALRWLTRSRVRHIAIVHRVSTPAKRLLIQAIAARGTDCFVHHFEACAKALSDAGVAPERRRLIPYMVDHRFWSQRGAQGERPPKRQICSVGQEFRDYPTLLRAVSGLPVRVELAIGSPWSQRRDGVAAADVPANVHVGRRAYSQLRDLYADSQFTVVPLIENDMQAGITTIVESMAMGRPVVASATTGQTGTVVDGLNGVTVPPGDPDALRAAVSRLLSDPSEVRRLGEGARQFVCERMTIEDFVERMSALVAEVGAQAPARRPRQARRLTSPDAGGSR